jgi:hypothetical protein
MPQLFPRRSNTIVRAGLAGAVLLVAGGAWASYRVYWSPYTTQVRQPVQQTVPFSHKHHVGGLGIDCRYCHTGVETSAFAGIPPTETCMTCHSQVWRDAPVLAPVRESWASGKPLRWRRVNDLPDYVYFDHSIHVAKGVGCESCHGPVNEMPLTWKEQSLYMRWCLDCHRDPARQIRPREKVFDMVAWKDPALGQKLVEAYHIQPERLSDCSTCHR